MAVRPRLIIDTDEETRLAVRLAASREGVSISDFVARVLRKAMGTDLLKDARKYAGKKKV